MKTLQFLFISILISASNQVFSVENDRSESNSTVPYVDINRYMGQWFEIASIPVRFQRDCVGTTANYKLLENGQVQVLNTCRKFELDGELVEAKGRGRVVEAQTNSKLEISFVGPFFGDTWFFWADYWIVELGENYEYAVVGSPSREYLWVLSRDKTMNDELFNAILERRKLDGYDTTKLKRTKQK